MASLVWSTTRYTSGDSYEPNNGSLYLHEDTLKITSVSGDGLKLAGEGAATVIGYCQEAPSGGSRLVMKCKSSLAADIQEGLRKLLSVTEL